MHPRNEWYWNLNIHRNQPMLNNAVAVNGSKLPISSAMYTSAVLTDHGICVGMRNVNLKGANCSYSSKVHDIPNCCSNTNIVGQRNNQTWTSAYEQMRLSALTDPSMATQIEKQHFETLPIDAKWNDETAYPMEDCDLYDCDPNPSDEISAELNPFHLFGDKSSLSTINYKERPTWNHSTDSIKECFHRSIPTLNNNPYLNYHYLSEIENQLNRPSLHSQSNYIYQTHMSSCSNSPTSHLPSSKLKATAPNRRMAKSASRLNHVVAPKKKWIRNYMQSNSHIWFFFPFCFSYIEIFLYIFGLSFHFCSFLCCSHSSNSPR